MRRAARGGFPSGGGQRCPGVVGAALLVGCRAALGAWAVWGTGYGVRRLAPAPRWGWVSARVSAWPVVVPGAAVAGGSRLSVRGALQGGPLLSRDAVRCPPFCAVVGERGRSRAGCGVARWGGGRWCGAAVVFGKVLGRAGMVRSACGNSGVRCGDGQIGSDSGRSARTGGLPTSSRPKNLKKVRRN